MKKAPRNKLTPLRVKATPKPVKTGDVIHLHVEGDYPTRYNEASAIVKEANELMKDFKPIMLPQAQEEVFRHNCERPWETVSSVALRDDNDNILRVSFLNKFSDVPIIQAEVLFATIKTKAKDGKPGETPDINDYLQFLLVPKFDPKAVLDAEGKFDQVRFKKFHDAIQAVAQELKIENPLSAEKQILPLPTFGARRWTDFDYETNQRISEVIQGQINFTPCPNAVTGKMVGEKENKK